MKYKTHRALEMAVKAEAKKSPMDTGQAVSSFYFHRFLCRVFRSAENGFVLKGGQSMLARTVDARVTRDIDLLSKEKTLESALEELKRAASTDLDDFMRFEFRSAKEIKTGDEYRSGLNVIFIPWLGPKRLQTISIDLVVDEIPLECVDVVTPADRINIEGIESFDYLLYPVENALADKFFGITERRGGRPSSRVKDLVDIVVYAFMCSFDGNKLTTRMQREAGTRGVDLPRKFTVPKEWTELFEQQFSRLHAQTGLPQEYDSIAAGAKLAACLFDPALAREVGNHKWNPSELQWVENKG